MIDAVVFDLDDTICSYRVDGAEVLAAAFERVGVEPVFGIHDYYDVYDEFVERAETVEAQRELCFAELADAAGESPAVGRAVARAFTEDRDHADVAFRDGAERALSTLGEAYPLGLVTNGAPGMQATKLAALGIEDAFDVVVHAGHDAPPKPAPEPFHLALDRLGVDAGRAVYVGNSLQTDVLGAKRAGLRAIWVPIDGDADPGEYRPDHVLASLRDLLSYSWQNGQA